MTNDRVIEFTHLLYTNKLTVADRFRLLTMFRDLLNEANAAHNEVAYRTELHDIALDDVCMLQDDRRELRREIAELRKLTESQTKLIAHIGEYLNGKATS